MVDKKNIRIRQTHLQRHALIYCRQATQVGDNARNLERQRCQTESELITLIDEDIGKSGSATTHRAGWKKMMKEIKKDHVGAVFVSDVSRLARNFLDFESLRLLAYRHHVLFVVDGCVHNANDVIDTLFPQVWPIKGADKN